MLLRTCICVFMAMWLSLNDSIAQEVTQKRVTAPTISNNPSPRLLTQYPTQASINVSVATQITLQFNKAIQKGTGNLIIQKQKNQTPVQIIEVASTQVEISGNLLKINLLVPLAHNTTYAVYIDKNYVKDMVGNGYDTQATWSFTTEKLAEQKLLEVFPNPATDHFNVRLIGVPIKVARMELYNSKGELIKAQLLKPIKSSDLERKVWIKDQPAGIYILRVITPNYFMEKRVVKE